MRCFSFLTSAFLSLPISVVCAQVENSSTTPWPLHDDGINKVVEWDHYSFLINGQRLYLFGGEFHYWRYPVPELWEDLLLKIKAAGFNSFSIYSNWAYHAPSPDVLDFTSGSRNFSSIFDLAQKIGLYVLYRPGPYVNAETNAGGFPLWLTTGAYGELRNNDTRYTEAWKPYMEAVSKIVSPYLITNGGNVIAYQIENELGDQWVGDPADKVPDLAISEYMELLKNVSRESGIDIPLSFNNPNMNADSWSMDYEPGALGNVDVVGLDSYPSCWSCNLDECTTTNGPYVPYQVQLYYDYFTRISPTQPNFMPEFQGGSYNPWGGPEGGCPDNSNQDFANLFYRHNIAERVTAQNLYMLYGGTSWGYLPAPVVATSYDYSAPISEDRSIADKYYETKLLALFLRAAKDLAKTDRLGNSTSYTNNTNVFTSELRNPDTNGAFYVTIHANSSSSTAERFQISVNTTAGVVKIPKFSPATLLNGHISKIIVTDFSFGGYTLRYSTAEVLSTAVLDGIPTIAFWVPTGESGEVAFKGFMNATHIGSTGKSDIQFNHDNGTLVVSVTQGVGMTIIDLDAGRARMIFTDRATAYRFWAPTLSTDPFVPEGQALFIQGPYLVRSASINGSTLVLNGDIDITTSITIFAPKAVQTVTWNTKTIKTTSANGILSGSIYSPSINISLPALTNWKSSDALPEKEVDYDDSGPAWVIANKTESTNPTSPLSLPVLYMDEYGFHVGVSLYRASISGSPTFLTIGAQGGTAFGFSVFLNGNHLGSHLGNSTIEAKNMTFPIDSANLPSESEESILLVVLDNTGHALRSGALDPRGLIYTNLTNGTITTWKLAGTVGGESNLDTIRGPLAEGGLTSERLGWHLPNFDTTKWSTHSPSIGRQGAGITFYSTTTTLSLPLSSSSLDISILFTLSIPANSTKTLRCILWINGYNYGLFNPSVGNQLEFPVPTGILDLEGVNHVALSVWNQGEGVARVDVGWRVAYVHESGFDFGFDAGWLRSGYDSAREVYA